MFGGGRSAKLLTEEFSKPRNRFYFSASPLLSERSPNSARGHRGIHPLHFLLNIFYDAIVYSTHTTCQKIFLQLRQYDCYVCTQLATFSHLTGKMNGCHVHLNNNHKHLLTSAQPSAAHTTDHDNYPQTSANDHRPISDTSCRGCFVYAEDPATDTNYRIIIYLGIYQSY